MADSPAPVGFVLWHREDRRHERWKRVAVVWHHADAVGRIDGPGDWWLEAIRDAEAFAEVRRAEQPTLFELV